MDGRKNGKSFVQPCLELDGANMNYESHLCLPVPTLSRRPCTGDVCVLRHRHNTTGLSIWWRRGGALNAKYNDNNTAGRSGFLPVTYNQTTADVCINPSTQVASLFHEFIPSISTCLFCSCPASPSGDTQHPNPLEAYLPGCSRGYSQTSKSNSGILGEGTA